MKCQSPSFLSLCDQDGQDLLRQSTTFMYYPQGAHDQLNVHPKLEGMMDFKKTEPPPDLLLSHIVNSVLGSTNAL